MGEFEPVIDDEQNWNYLDGSFNSTHTALKFSRKFDTCDDQDVPLVVSLKIFHI